MAHDDCAGCPACGKPRCPCASSLRRLKRWTAVVVDWSSSSNGRANRRGALAVEANSGFGAGVTRRSRYAWLDFVQLHTRVTLERGAEKRFSLTPRDVLGPGGVIEVLKVMPDRARVGS